VDLRPPDPTAEERFEICLRHARNALAYEPNLEKAVREFRKHLAWYTKGLPDGRRLRDELFGVQSLEDMKDLLRSYLEGRRAPLALAS
jgi:tRNA-dihydrouridine synthase B